MPRRSAGLALLVALALGAFLRVALPWPAVVTEHGILPPGGADEFYHHRRIEWTVENFPAVLTQDAYVSAPGVGEIVWPPLWDWSIAALAIPLGARGDRDRLEAVMAAVPPLVGLATIALVFWIARRQLGERAAAASAFVLAVLPAHQLSSQLAKSDHHVGATLATGWLLFVGMRWLDGPSRHARWRTAIELGLAMTTALLLWTGALLHVGLTLGVCVAVILSTEQRDRALARARELALACAVAGASIAPFSLGVSWREYGSFSPLVLSSFQPALFGAGALVLFASATAWAGTGLGARRGSRGALALGLGAVALLTTTAVTPALFPSLLVGAGWFQEAEAFQGHVLELRSLWWTAGAFDADVAQLLFTRAIALTLPVSLWLAWRAARGGEATGIWLLVVWSVAFLGAASSQIRFSNELALPVALISGAFVQRASQPRLAAAALAFVVSGTALTIYAEPAGRVLAGASEGRPRGIGLEERIVTLVPFARWLGANSPETAGWFDADARPEYAVLTPWSQGHLVRYYARRPMVQDNFGVYGGRASYEAAERYYGEHDEERAVAVLEELGVRYVLASPEGSGHGEPYEPHSMARRLALHRGLGARDVGTDGSPLDVLPLARHRLIQEVDWTLGVDEGNLDPLTRRAAAYRWFELVKGARIEGVATAGAVVTARIELRSGSRRYRYETRARVGDDGRYSLAVPYASGERGSGVESPGPYTVTSSRGSGRVHVSEAAVRDGLRVAGPDLRGE